MTIYIDEMSLFCFILFDTWVAGRLLPTTTSTATRHAIRF